MYIFHWGGSRKGEKRTLLNILIVFLISGIWHGAGWTFIIWGSLHGIASLINRLWKNHCRPIPNIISIPLTFFFVNIFWVFFRAESVERALLVISSMFNNLNFTLTPDYKHQLVSILPYTINMIILFISFILAVFGPTAYQFMQSDGKIRIKQIISIIVFIVSLFFISRVVTFLYFNF